MASMTAATALARLRISLNDVDEGSYSDADLLACINRSIHEIEILSQCNKVNTDITLIQGQSQYDMSPMFRVYVAVLQGTPLTRLRDVNWSEEASGLPSDTGEPERFWEATGDIVEVFPVPSAAYAGQVVHLYGAGSSDDIEAAGSITTIPLVYAQTLMLSRAEGIARLLRGYNQLNVQIASLIQQDVAMLATGVREVKF